MAEPGGNYVVVIAVVAVAIIGAAIKFLMQYYEWKGKINAKSESFDTVIRNIESKFSAINTRLDNIWSHISGSPATTRAESPIRLTEFGHRISSEWRARDWVRPHAEHLKSQAFGKEEFEVYELCKDYIENYRFTTEERRSLHSVAYENGTTVDRVYEVLIIELRDRILQIIK